MNGAVKVLLLDIAILAGVYGILADDQWKSTYAKTGIGGLPSFNYGFLTQTFSIQLTGKTLTSPPTLSWLEVLAILLVVSNGLFVYRTIRRRRKEHAEAPPASN